MGDAQVFSWTAVFNRNTAQFFAKWMRDIAADSSLDKGVPHLVPDIMETYSSSAWSDAAVIIPWVVYQTYGDKRILEESWKCMHEWIDYIRNHTNDDGLWMSGYQYGDWLALDKEEMADRTGATDKYMIANAYYIYVTDIVSQTAEVLGREEEAEKYRSLYEKTPIMPDGSFETSGMNSLNHYAYGSIGDWMYRKIAGINQIEPGYRKFMVCPMFRKGIEEAEASFESPYGRIVSSWSL